MSDDGKISRRNFFLRGTAAGCGLAAASLASSLLPLAAAAPAPGKPGRTRPGLEPWEVPPPPIPARKIREVVEADVVVLGTGIAGLTAAASAAEKGAKTVLLGKWKTYVGNGGGVGAFNSKIQQADGGPWADVERKERLTRDALIYGILREGSYRGDQRVVTLWVDQSGACLDWLNGILERYGDSFINPLITAHDLKSGGRNFTVFGYVEDYARKLRVDVRYEHEGVRLLRRPDGRVTGLIARNGAGEYVQFNAKGGVILCTGGYAHNMAMLEKWQPTSGALAESVSFRPALNTGDGIKMALWIGAAVDDTPHLSNLFDGGMEGWLPEVGGRMPIDRQPWLYVNQRGERYVQEGLPLYGYRCNAVLSQPGHRHWVIWDGKWEKDAEVFVGEGCAKMKGHAYHPEHLASAMKKGLIKQAPSLAELARLMEVPWDNFKATVDRYNELYRLKADPDFGKNPAYLTSIVQPPFFAAKTGPTSLGTLSGLKINNRLEVLDAVGAPIPGLYAAGNDSGCMFFNCFPFQYPTLTTGRAMVFGRLAALRAADVAAKV
ncbi:MAG: FAD-binding protein [Holophaga sp.]|nr:FAD-binding protein [Holophaga sp.]